MLIKILLVISILVQTLATVYALRLVRTTKYNSVWILFIVGFSLHHAFDREQRESYDE